MAEKAVLAPGSHANGLGAGGESRMGPASIGFKLVRSAQAQPMDLPVELDVPLQLDLPLEGPLPMNGALQIDDLLQSTLETALDSAVDGGVLDPTTSANAMVFVLIAALGLLMALIYVPLRLFLTLTARSRRLRLLQRIRQLRDELGKPVGSSSGT